MLGKIIAVVAVVTAVVSADPCGLCGGYLSPPISGYELNGGCGSRVLNTGYAAPFVSAFPTCSPVATPSAVFDTAIAAPTAVAPIASTQLVSSGTLFSGLSGSRCYGGYGYGSALNVCGNDVLASVC